MASADRAQLGRHGFLTRRWHARHRRVRRREGLPRALSPSGLHRWPDSSRWGVWGKTIAFQHGEEESGTIEASQLIVAAGARDRPVAFKSLVATQLVLPGERILMAGSGPLALAFSAQLHAYGAEIVEVHEAAPPPGVRPHDPNTVRALTRAGMGRCQGRNCGSHIAAVVARQTNRTIEAVELPTVRPPVNVLAAFRGDGGDGDGFSVEVRGVPRWPPR